MGRLEYGNHRVQEILNGTVAGSFVIARFQNSYFNGRASIVIGCCGPAWPIIRHSRDEPPDWSMSQDVLTGCEESPRTCLLQFGLVHLIIGGANQVVIYHQG